jgi:hypothetical protein
VANVAVKMGNRKGKIGKKVDSGYWILEWGDCWRLGYWILDTGFLMVNLSAFFHSCILAFSH